MSVKALAEVVVAEIGGSRAAAMRAVSAVFNAISEATEGGRHVTIKKFGTFRRSLRSARTYDTRCGVVIKPDRKFLSFKCVPSQKKVVV